MKTTHVTLAIALLILSLTSCGSLKKLKGNFDIQQDGGNEIKIETELLPQDPLSVDAEIMGP